MYPSVTKVVAHKDFTLLITFDNDEEGVLDMKPHLGLGVFERISDYEKFKTARVAFDTVEWDGGVLSSCMPNVRSSRRHSIGWVCPEGTDDSPAEVKGRGSRQRVP